MSCDANNIDVKNRLFSILDNADTLCTVLKKEWDENFDVITEYKLQVGYQIRNFAFASLMMIETPCNFIRDIELGSKEIATVIMPFENKKYECRAVVLKQILGDKYNSVMEQCGFGENNTQRDKEIIKDEMCVIAIQEDPNVVSENDIYSKKEHLEDTSEINKKTETVISESESSEHKSEHKQEKKAVQKKSASKKKTTFAVAKSNKGDNKDVYEHKADNVSKNKVTDNELSTGQAVTLNLRVPDEPELAKSIKTMMFDLNDVGVFNIKDGKGEYVNFTIVPLTVPPTGNELVSDIFVCAETMNEKKVYVSEKAGKKSIITCIGDYEFIIRGSWKNGVFSSSIHPANQKLVSDYDKNEEKTSFVPEDINQMGFGHNVCFYEEDDKTISKIHVVPIDLQNNKVGIANIMACVEKDDGSRIVMVSENNMLVYNTETAEVQIFGYWDDNDTFIINVKRR